MHRSWLFALAMGCAGHHAPKVTDAASSVYVRSDTDATTIVSPSVKIAGRMDNVTAAAAYSVDAWTGASVDVVTAATKAITERRHEVNGTLGYEANTVSVSANYRFSTENDYTSNGLTLGAKADLAGKNTTISVDALGSADTVGRSGDPGFSRSVTTAGGRAQVAQVIDRNTIAELGWQTTLVDGYQASPYRFVAIGDTGTCGSRAPFCLPEQVPNKRLRNALLARTRRALGRTLSLGVEYRFYFDDWGIRSHAVQPDLALRLTDTQSLDLRYRYAAQSEASFYRPRYFEVAATNGYLTRDRKLSAMVTNEAGVQYTYRSDDVERVWLWGLRATVSRLDYLAYVGLDHVWAAEVTALVGVELP